MSSRPRWIGRRMAVLAVLAVVGAAGSTTMAAFVATSSKGGNSIASGSVTITDNDSGTALLTLAAAQPGETDSGCIAVTYAGSLSSGVRLYGTTTGSGLDQYLDLRVTRGTHNPSDPGFDSCANFQADATNYIGAGNGVIYNGTLQGYADSYAAGLVDPLSGSPRPGPTARRTSTRST